MFKTCPTCMELYSITETACPACAAEKGQTRIFETGATRDVDADKLDFEGAISPVALEAFVAYMHHCRKMPDKSLRPPDNWQRGMPLNSYIQSALRHVLDWWKSHRAISSREGVVFALCGVWFNVQGYLHEYLKAHPEALAEALKNHPRPGWEPRVTENWKPGYIVMEQGRQYSMDCRHANLRYKVSLTETTRYCGDCGTPMPFTEAEKKNGYQP